MKLSETDVPKIVRNEWFYFVARASMIVATLIGLPTAGFMLQRVISTGDAIEASIVVQGNKLDLLSQRVEIQSKINERELNDHEGRIRLLERR